MPLVTKTAYPTDTDLITRLTAMGIPALFTDPAGWGELEALLPVYVQAAIDQWEQETDYRPFLCQKDGGGLPVVTTRYFDPPSQGLLYGGNAYGGVFLGSGQRTPGGGRLLSFGCGVTALPTIQTGIEYDGTTGAVISGSATTRNLNADYILKPDNALTCGRPIQYAQWRYGLFGGLQSISVAAVFGFCQNVPLDVWRAILDYATILTLADVGPQISGGMTSWKDENASEAYGGMPFEEFMAQMQRRWRGTIKRYLRPDYEQ